jgi:hypothetical protein
MQEELGGLFARLKYAASSASSSIASQLSSSFGTSSFGTTPQTMMGSDTCRSPTAALPENIDNFQKLPRAAEQLETEFFQRAAAQVWCHGLFYLDQ